MKRVKTSGRCSLGSERLEHLVRIGEEGAEFEKFDATPYANAWAKAKVWRPNQGKEKRGYKKRSTKSSANEPLDSSSDESDFEGFEEEDFNEEEINILLNKQTVDWFTNTLDE